MLKEVWRACVASKLNATTLGRDNVAHPQIIMGLELLRNALLGGWAVRQGRFDMGDHDREPVQRCVRVLGLDDLCQVAQFCHQPPWD
jgi:hypothetical protein